LSNYNSKTNGYYVIIISWEIKGRELIFDRGVVGGYTVTGLGMPKISMNSIAHEKHKNK